MNTMKNSLDELKATLNEIRREKHPNIPVDVINQIVEAQAKNQDNATKRRTETELIIDSYVRSLDREEKTL